jgi:catechol 2,3-dioxygenase-like lactoylglutathione lyase family enzyme
MLDHVSITVSDIAAAERFYDAIMKALDIVKVGRRDDWLGYGERARRLSGTRLSTGSRRSAITRSEEARQELVDAQGIGCQRVQRARPVAPAIVPATPARTKRLPGQTQTSHGLGRRAGRV